MKKPAIIKARKATTVMAMLMLMVMALASCQTTSSSLGGGPLTISPEVNKSFQSYLGKTEPLIFVVSADGNVSSRYYCRTLGACVATNERRIALSDCNMKASVPCQIFAIRKNVVWEGPVSVRGEQEAIGNGPLTITQRTNMNFQNYLNLPNPKAFAVSANGVTSGWFYCKELKGCSSLGAGQRAVDFCNNSAPPGDKTCRIFALERNVVWKGQVRAANQ